MERFFLNSIAYNLYGIWYRKKTAAEWIYQKALEDGLNVTRKDIKEWLKLQDTYTRYKPIVRKHKYRQTLVYYLGEQIRMDLVVMYKYKNQNKGYWILTAVEILSRYAFICLSKDNLYDKKCIRAIKTIQESI